MRLLKLRSRRNQLFLHGACPFGDLGNKQPGLAAYMASERTKCLILREEMQVLRDQRALAHFVIQPGSFLGSEKRQRLYTHLAISQHVGFVVSDSWRHGRYGL